MNYQKFICTLGLVVLAVVILNGRSAEAQTVANGPYYANPSWDQQLPVATRFIVLSNWIDTNFPSGGAAVLDRETGLVWQRSPSTSPLSWAGARNSCNAIAVGNRKGWRLPTVQELASLIDPSQSNPTLPSGHPFPTVQSSGYWSATTLADSDSTTVWVVTFNTGTVGVSLKSGPFLFWCVRGGQGVDPQ
jgi:hypothetical protein